MIMGPLVNDNPPNEEYPDELELQNAINVMQLTVSDSEEDNTDVDSFGYQLLPQEPAVDSDQEWPANHEFTILQDLPLPETPFYNDFHGHTPGTELAQQGQSKLSEESKNEDRLAMNSEHIEVIKASMAGFTLPASSIPAWAKVIPEDQWKSQLASMINNRVASTDCSFFFEEVDPTNGQTTTSDSLR